MDIGKITFVTPCKVSSGDFEVYMKDGMISGIGVKAGAYLYGRQLEETDQVVSKYARFMHIARGFASMSKNPTSKVGSVALGPDFEVRSSGWNGAPRGCNADEDERFADRTERLYWTTHSEANAIAQAARIGASLKGCTLVVTHAPCMSCANLIVQAGIIRVINPVPEEPFATRWAADITRTRTLFKECGVHHHEIDPQEEVK